MKAFLITLLVLLGLLVIAFLSWFFAMKAKGKCPICMLQKILIPRKITMDIEEEPNHSNTAAPRPPMGWSSWNTFRNNINQDLILETAHAMVDSGLAEAGYQYINLDDCWQSSSRDAEGKLQGDLNTFSRGIPSLIQGINQLGLKVGLYSSNGTLTCEDLPASLGNEMLDAETFATWGCEFLKYDFCHHIRISGDCPPIEQLVLNPVGDTTERILKPEDAVFSGRAKIMNADEPGKQAIGFLGYGSGSAKFTLDGVEGGEYVLTVVHLKPLARRKQYMQAVVNGTLYELFFPETKGFSQSGRTQIKIMLSAGKNTIEIKNPVKTHADSSYLQYRRMGNALKAATKRQATLSGTPEKEMVFSICEWGMANPYLWGAKAGEMWRTTPDITPNWKRIMWIYHRSLPLYEYAGPHHWNDPDMLEVGNGKLTEAENKSHFSLWCMMAAPLMLGNDIRRFVVDGQKDAQNEVLRIVTNQNLIAIDQDPLGKAAKRIQKQGDIEILARPLEGGDIALCLFNGSSRSKTVHFDLSELTKDPYLGLSKETGHSYELHNMWTDEQSVGTSITEVIEKHGTLVYRIKGEA